MAPQSHPPTPGPVVQPNFLAVLEAMGDVTFPISKRDLLEQLGEATAVMRGRNVDLHMLIKDIHDDFFDDEAELQAALERHYASATDADELPIAAERSWPPLEGPGESPGPATVPDAGTQRPGAE